jgi:uncharacterized protein (DUF58 family)
MPLDLATIHALARVYALALPDAMRRRDAGDLLGRGTGSSIEYQDHRSYFLGDDVRHIDWRAYARTDRLTMKMYRQEISPTIDVIVDTSRSCGVDDEKRGLLLDLGGLLAVLAGGSRGNLRIWTVGGGRVHAVARPEALGAATFEPHEDPIAALRGTPAARRRGIKLFVSDFLFPHDPTDLVSVLGSASDRLVFVQVLSRFEAEPELSEGLRLVESETGEIIDLTLDQETVDEYKRRLHRLQGEVRRQVERAGGLFAVIDATRTLAEAAGILAQERILAVPA